MHTLLRPSPRLKSLSHFQCRDLNIQETASAQMLQRFGVPISEDENPKSRDYFLEVTVDRAKFTPCIITSFSIGGESPESHAKVHSLRLDKKVNASTFSSIAAELKCKPESFDSLTKILSSMINIFFSNEAFSLTARLSRNAQGQLAVARSNFNFDDAAFRSSKRQEDIQILRNIQEEVPEEVEAEKDGIVYIK